ncbi:RecQ-mediated genome instability protein 1 [Microdochium nivale]|nr:RecQ-mediated genome instability protein 1 [Microdochium nivale]
MDSTPLQIRTGLQAQGLPPPSTQWIQTVMPQRRPLPPMPALVATVKARLLAADLTNPSIFDHTVLGLPHNLSNPEVRESKLPRDVLVQVLDLDNLSKSKWEQIEELEAIARGEQTRGREVIRLPTASAEEDEDLGTQSSTPMPATVSRAAAGAAPSAPKYATHRLVLQDCKGQKIHGLEHRRIERISIGILNIGEKILLKQGSTVARGNILLEPSTCVVQGGRVEAWHKGWTEGRLARLREAVGDSR